MASWLDPALSLSAEAAQEWDRRQAAAQHRDELSALADRLIVAHYQHERILKQALKRVTELEVKLMLAEAKPAPPAPAARHLAWARELLRRP